MARPRWCDTRRRKSEPTGNTNFGLTGRQSPTLPSDCDQDLFPDSALGILQARRGSFRNIHLRARMQLAVSGRENLAPESDKAVIIPSPLVLFPTPRRVRHHPRRRCLHGLDMFAITPFAGGKSGGPTDGRRPDKRTLRRLRSARLMAAQSFRSPSTSSTPLIRPVGARSRDCGGGRAPPCRAPTDGLPLNRQLFPWMPRSGNMRFLLVLRDASVLPLFRSTDKRQNR